MSDENSRVVEQDVQFVLLAEERLRCAFDGGKVREVERDEGGELPGGLLQRRNRGVRFLLRHSNGRGGCSVCSRFARRSRRLARPVTRTSATFSGFAAITAFTPLRPERAEA